MPLSLLAGHAWKVPILEEGCPPHRVEPVRAATHHNSHLQEVIASVLPGLKKSHAIHNSIHAGNSVKGPLPARSLCALPLLHVAGYSGVLLAALRPPAGHRPSVSPAGVERMARLDRPGVVPLPASRAAVAAPAARRRILHTRRHDQAERARCRGLVRAACEGRLWPQQVHQTDLKACRRRAVVARARDRCRGAECSGEPAATRATKW